MTHTPGPWKVDEKRPYLITGEASGSGRYKQGALVNLAVCGSHDGAISNEEELANMRLMASSPSMLVELECLLGCLEIDSETGAPYFVDDAAMWDAYESACKFLRKLKGGAGC